VVVTVIGGTGNGGAPLTTGTKATTPDHQPNLVVRVINPLVALAVRFAYAYLTMLVGLVAAGQTSDIIPAKDFVDLVLACAKLSVAGAGFGLLKDCLTLFSQLEKKYPLATGSV
jgi:hypothetical protein